MGFFKNISERAAGNRFVRLIANKYVAVTVLGVLWTVFLDQNNCINYVRIYYENICNARTIRQLEAKIRETDEKLHELDSNLVSLEKFAREQYLFHKEGETVFVVEYGDD